MDDRSTGEVVKFDKASTPKVPKEQNEAVAKEILDKIASFYKEFNHLEFNKTTVFFVDTAELCIKEGKLTSFRIDKDSVMIGIQPLGTDGYWSEKFMKLDHVFPSREAVKAHIDRNTVATTPTTNG